LPGSFYQIAKEIPSYHEDNTNVNLIEMLREFMSQDNQIEGEWPGIQQQIDAP